MLPSIQDIQKAAQIIYQSMPPTPQYCWPMLCEKLGTEIWLKHENHTPVGAFKIRGGLVYFENLRKSGEAIRGVICATRGNHGQSIGFAAQKYGIPATVVVPKGNSTDKNTAMKAMGVELIEHGEDFQESLEFAQKLADDLNLHMVPSFHPLLVTGVATYSYELFHAVQDLDTVYVPIGLGSGICGMIAVRDAMELKTQIVGVVSSHANAYAQSFQSQQLIQSPATTALADGMACRTPNPQALEIIRKGVDHIVEVTDQEVTNAMRLLFSCTHNAVEGAGAASFAAALQEKEQNSGKKIAAILTGGNADKKVFARILSSQNVM